MTDQEILKEYREKIEKEITQLHKQFKIKDDLKKQEYAAAYKQKFIEEFRKEQREVRHKAAKVLLEKGVDVEIISKGTSLAIEEILQLE